MTKLHISIFFKTILFTWNTHKLTCNQPMKTRFTVSICGTRDKKKWEPLVTLELCQIYIQTSTHSVGGILSFMMTTWCWAGHSNVYNGTIELTNKPHRSSNKNDKKWHLQSCPVTLFSTDQTPAIELSELQTHSKVLDYGKFSGWSPYNVRIFLLGINLLLKHGYLQLNIHCCEQAFAPFVIFFFQICHIHMFQLIQLIIVLHKVSLGKCKMKPNNWFCHPCHSCQGWQNQNCN